MFDNSFLASSNQIKLCPIDIIFSIKQEGIFDYNPLCFMSSGLMLDNIIMNIFTDSIINNGIISEASFLQNPGWYNALVKRIPAGFYTEKKNADTKKTLRVHHFIEKEKLWKYLSGILSIDNNEADLGKKKICSSMILATLIINISFSATTNLYPIYTKNHVTYHLWQPLDSVLVKMNRDVMSTCQSKCFFSISFLWR